MPQGHRPNLPATPSKTQYKLATIYEIVCDSIKITETAGSRTVKGHSIIALFYWFCYHCKSEKASDEVNSAIMNNKNVKLDTTLKSYSAYQQVCDVNGIADRLHEKDVFYRDDGGQHARIFGYSKMLLIFSVALKMFGNNEAPRSVARFIGSTVHPENSHYDIRVGLMEYMYYCMFTNPESNDWREMHHNHLSKCVCTVLRRFGFFETIGSRSPKEWLAVISFIPQMDTIQTTLSTDEQIKRLRGELKLKEQQIKNVNTDVTLLNAQGNLDAAANKKQRSVWRLFLFTAFISCLFGNALVLNLYSYSKADECTAWTSARWIVNITTVAGILIFIFMMFGGCESSTQPKPKVLRAIGFVIIGFIAIVNTYLHWGYRSYMAGIQDSESNFAIQSQ